MAKKKYYWVENSSLFLGGKRPSVSKNGVIPDDVIKDMPREKLEKLINKGSVALDLNSKSASVAAELSKVSKNVKILRKANEKLVAEKNKALEDLNVANNKIQEMKSKLAAAMHDRDKALAGLKKQNAAQGG